MTVDLTRAEPRRGTKAYITRARQRAVQAVELHLAGVSYPRIADQLGYANEGGAWKAVQRLLARQENAAAEEMKRTEGARLDRLLVAIWPKATAGDLKAHAQAVRNRESYRRLYGLDSPIKVQSVRSEVDEEIMRLTAQLGGTVPPPVEVPAEPDDAEAGSS